MQQGKITENTAVSGIIGQSSASLEVRLLVYIQGYLNNTIRCPLSVDALTEETSLINEVINRTPNIK